MNRKALCLWALVALLSSCEVERPSYVLAEERMEEVLHDYHLAKAMADELPYDQSYRKVLYQKGVFEKHGISEAQFDSSLVWYTRHTQLLAAMYERVNLKLKRERERVNDLIALRDGKPAELLSGDSVVVWGLKKPQLLTGMPWGCKLTFEVTADSTFHLRDSITFHLRYRYLPQRPDSLSQAVMALSMKFKNDSILYREERLTADTVADLSLGLQSDTLGEIQKVHGFVYLPFRKDSVRLRIERVDVMRTYAKDSVKVPDPAVEQQGGADKKEGSADKQGGADKKEGSADKKEGSADKQRGIVDRKRAIMDRQKMPEPAAELQMSEAEGEKDAPQPKHPRMRVRRPEQVKLQPRKLEPEQ